jgi:DNA-binding transcriptional regulator PaaX
MKSDRTRTLLFGIFVTAGRPLTASQVSHLAAPLGISATNVKSHLTRLVAEGALDRSGPVRLAKYVPSPSQASIADGINARLGAGALEPNAEAWDGGWLMLALEAPKNRKERESMRISLWFDGFRPVPGANDTYIRPGWPKDWAISRARVYPGACNYGTLLAPLGRPKFDAMYSLDDMDREAKKLARWIQQRKVPPSDARAFAALMDVGGRLARLIAHDPRLPPVLWGGRTGIGELLRAYHDFEGRVKSASQRFIENTVNCGED